MAQLEQLIFASRRRACGDENDNKQGRDWLTNFDFDQDGDFSNNRVNWLNIPQYVNASAVGPSATIAGASGQLSTRSHRIHGGREQPLVLFYHIYNAADKDGSDIHDWERVEISVRGVTGTPGGGGEYVNHVVGTMHEEQLIRRYYDSGGVTSCTTAQASTS